MTNILSITNDREQRRFIKSALEKEAIKVKDCASIKQGVEAFREEQFPILVVDLLIPDSSGIEVIKHFKKISENLIVILLSRIRTRTLIEKAFRLGADDVLIYPLSPEALRETVLHRIRNAKVAEVVFEQS